MPFYPFLHKTSKIQNPSQFWVPDPPLVILWPGGCEENHHVKRRRSYWYILGEWKDEIGSRQAYLPHKNGLIALYTVVQNHLCHKPNHPTFANCWYYLLLWAKINNYGMFFSRSTGWWCLAKLHFFRFYATVTWTWKRHVYILKFWRKGPVNIKLWRLNRAHA